MNNFEELQGKISGKFTPDILHEILRKQSGSKNVNVENISFGEGVTKGDSYLSDVTRFTIEYSALDKSENQSSKVLHVIAKSLIRNIAQRKTFRSYDFFKNEFNFYEKVWPQLDAFQKAKKVADLFCEIPNYLYGYVDGENDYILMEDLSFAGYKSFQRGEEVTLDQAKILMKNFARFHALSFAFKKENPELFQKAIAVNLYETYFHERYRNWYTNFQKKLIEITLDAIKQELPEEYYKKLESVISDDIYGKVCQLMASESRFAVVTHGDAWLPNFLGKYDDKSSRLIDTVMIDFQLTRCAPFCQDLIFFMYGCMNENFRAKHYHELLHCYCKEFQAFYEQFREELVMNTGIVSKDIQNNGLFALGMVIEVIVMSMLEDDEVSDLGLIEGTEAVPLESVWIVKPLKTKEKRQRLANCIKDMIDHKFF